MHLHYLLLFLLLAPLAACRSAADWREGGIYAVPHEQDTYAVLKILALDDEGVHVRMYSNVYTEVPDHVDEGELYLAGASRGPDELPGLEHAPLSRRTFDAWEPAFIQQSEVAPEELEQVNVWRAAGGSYF